MSAAKRKRCVELRTCVGRDPLMHGSRQCEEMAEEPEDLCRKHAKLIAPHQLLNGVFYANDGEDESS